MECGNSIEKETSDKKLSNQPKALKKRQNKVIAT